MAYSPRPDSEDSEDLRSDAQLNRKLTRSASLPRRRAHSEFCEQVVELTGPCAAQGRTWLRLALAYCTVGRAIGFILLLAFGIVWTVALHKIEEAANVRESASLESPRTAWSSKRTGQMSKWFDWQQTLAAEASAYEPASPYDARARLILLGDSITESWRGTSYGEASERAAGVPHVLQETLAKRWPNPLVRHLPLTRSPSAHTQPERATHMRAHRQRRGESETVTSRPRARTTRRRALASSPRGRCSASLATRRNTCFGGCPTASSRAAWRCAPAASPAL